MKAKLRLDNFIPLLAIPAAIYLPNIGKIFSPFTSEILSVLLFFSFLGLGLSELKKSIHDPTEPFFVSMVVLVVTPLVVFPVMQRFFPEYFLGAMLFALLPSAVSSPAITRIYGGNVAKATVNAIFANLLSPFTTTLFMAAFLATAVKVSISAALVQLLLIIVIPFVIGLLANRYAKPTINKTKKYYRLINLVLIFLIFFAALSPYTVELTSNIFNKGLWLAVLIVHLILLFFSKLTTLHISDEAERTGIEANMIFLNVGLGVVMAQNYFGPTEMLFIIFCEIMWILLVPAFKYVK